MKILELRTGLFPDADAVVNAIRTQERAHDVARMDATGLSPNDEDGWAAIAAAVLEADLVVTI
jgi:hypothetical protein